MAKPAAKLGIAEAAIASGLGARPRGRACPADHPILGNVEGLGRGSPEDPVYHTRERSGSYNRVTPEICFATEDNAKRAGFQAAGR